MRLSIGHQCERILLSIPAILSALIRGSGYIYSGHYGDGITAFLINALWIAGVVTGIHAEYYAVAGIVAGVGVPFYLGNIYGSANAAKKWNLCTLIHKYANVFTAKSPRAQRVRVLFYPTVRGDRIKASLSACGRDLDNLYASERQKAFSLAAADHSHTLST